MIFTAFPVSAEENTDILLYCSDDAYVENSESKKTQAFYSEQVMFFGEVYDRLAFLKFDIGTLSGREFEGALLNVTVSSKTTDKNLKVYETEGEWSGKSLTYASKPRKYKFLTQRPIDKFGIASYDIDVSEAVINAAREGKKHITFVFSSEAATSGVYSSENARESSRPRLTVSKDSVYVPGQVNTDYERPSQKQIAEDIRARVSSASHPYVFGRKEDFEKIREYGFGKDEVMTELYGYVKKTATSYLDLDVQRFDLSSRTLSNAYEAWDRISELAMVYLVEGDTKYAERAWKEMENIIKLDNWIYVLLDNSTTAMAVAVGYDWLYDYLTPERRKAALDAIKQKGLDIVTDIYRNPSIYASSGNPTGTTQTGAIFNPMNHNSHNNMHYLVSAVAIADDNPEYSAYIISNALRASENVMDLLFPDGGYYEGTGYWSYIGPKFALALSAMNSALGTMYGYDKTAGIQKTGYFPLYAQSSVGNIVYNDMYNYVKTDDEEIYFLAKIANDDNLKRLCIERGFKGKYLPLWYKPGELPKEGNSELTLDRQFRNVDLVTMRDTWEGEQEIFAGMRTQEAQRSHQDAGSGGFALDALGVRWVTGLGKEDYGLYDYWNYTQRGTRYTYFARRAEANNCVVINPSADPGQDITKRGTIDKFVSKNKGCFATAELGEVYHEYVKSYKRGIKLFDNRRRLMVQDEMTLLLPSEVYWFMTVKAKDIEILGDGKSAILKYNGRKLHFTVEANSDFTIEAANAVPLASSPNPGGQTVWREYRRIGVHFPKAAEELNITAVLTPFLSEKEIGEKENGFLPMDEWKVEDGECARMMLDSIEVNGERLENFNPYNRFYEIKGTGDLSQYNITAVSDKYDTEVIKNEDEKVFEIIVKDKNGSGDLTSYAVRIKDISETSVDLTKYRELKAARVFATSDDGNVAENVLDGRYDTRWSAEGEQSLTVDLGSSANVAYIGFATYQGNLRKGYYDIYVSENGSDWKFITSGETSGTTLDIEYTKIGHKCRYIKYMGYGNSTGTWNSLTEVKVFG